jgi:putative nucleotidyltransferase with HDIG domain
MRSSQPPRKSSIASQMPSHGWWTPIRHSAGVAAIADGIAAQLGVGAADRRMLRRAALLHDLGKLGVSNLILDKPGKLDAPEIDLVRQHPRNTAAILSRVSCFAPIARAAAGHHERLDGRGYHQGTSAAELPFATRILCVADMVEALRASRPYREGLSIDRTLAIIGRDRGTGVDPACCDAVGPVLEGLPAEGACVAPACQVQALAEDYTQAA